MTNPYTLTTHEIKIIEAVIIHGNLKITTSKLNLQTKAVENALIKVRRKIGVTSTLQAAVIWDRYARKTCA